MNLGNTRHVQNYVFDRNNFRVNLICKIKLIISNHFLAFIKIKYLKMGFNRLNLLMKI